MILPKPVNLPTCFTYSITNNSSVKIVADSVCEQLGIGIVYIMQVPTVDIGITYNLNDILPVIREIQ